MSSGVPSWEGLYLTVNPLSRSYMDKIKLQALVRDGWILAILCKTRPADVEPSSVNHQVSETVDLEEDLEAQCEDYSPLTDYGACVEAVTQRGYLDSLGCVPPWFSVAGARNVCQGRINVTYQDGARVPITQMDIKRVQVMKLLSLEGRVQETKILSLIFVKLAYSPHPFKMLIF